MSTSAACSKPTPILDTAPADEEMLVQIRGVSMPAYFVIDVSKSMEEANRIDDANEFAPAGQRSS